MSYQILKADTHKYANIIAVSKSVPKRCVSNEDLVAKGIDTSHEWVVQRTGIHQRYIAEKEAKNSDYAINAGREALLESGLKADEIQAIIVATSTPDHKGFPSMACVVQEALCMKNAFAFDISAACSGFSYALSVASQLMLAPTVKNVLVLGADCLSELVHWEDRSTCVLFGDGAGAVILQASNRPGLICSLLGSDGAHADILSVKANPAVKRKGFDENDPIHQAFIHMDGRSVFKLAVEKVTESIQKLLEENNISNDKIKFVVLHQANQRIISQIQAKCGFTSQQVVSVVSQYGNMSAASIPIALADIKHQIQEGDLLLFAGFGAGFTWGVNLIQWTQNKGDKHE